MFKNLVLDQQRHQPSKTNRHLGIRVENIPEALKANPRWVLWRYEARASGKPTKVPMTVAGRPASVSNQENWTTFDDAYRAYQRGGFSGIGYVLDPDCQGIDLDDCRNPETGELSELAQEVLSRVQGYAEISPSGTGIKLFTRFQFEGSRASKRVEIYGNTNRYFTVTGQVLEGRERMAEERQDIAWLIDREFGPESHSNGTDATGGAIDRFQNFKPPLIGWTLDRVKVEILSYLDPDCSYDDWLVVGMALHHQGQGDSEWCWLWEDWSLRAPDMYEEGSCFEKWSTFKSGNDFKKSAYTLASLIHRVKKEHKAGNGALEDFLIQIRSCKSLEHLRGDICLAVSRSGELTDLDRDIIAKQIKDQMGLLGAKPGINACRRLVEHKAEFIQPFANVNARGNPLCTLENLRQLLNSLGYGVRYNVIRKCIEFNIPGTKFLRDNRENASYSHILNSCEKVGMPTKHVHQYLITLADENPFNPVATWIESVPWDGVSRLDSFYETVISVGDQSLKKTLLRKWMVQAVAAAFSPDGIPAQGVLTFVGAQNIGKTTWFKRLAPNELDVILTGHTLDTRNKDSVFIALSYWMVELGEVDATFRKSDIAALKSFLTQPLDKLRRPYAATESSFGRRTVFGATVNEEQYLHDPTGNRRFWSIEVEKFVLDHELNMQQVWAEVLTLWRAGETFSLSREEIEALNSHNEQYTAVDPIEEKILSGFQWGSADTCQWLTATQILERLGIPFPTKGQTSAAGRVLKRCCHGGRKKSNGVARYPVPRQSEFDGLDFFQGQGNTG